MKKISSSLIFLVFILSISGLSAQDAMHSVSGKENGFPLPFLEQWNLGTFETNNWSIDGENWSINWQEGQPGPSAEFTWDPIQTDYQVALESYPLLADSLTEGQIWLFRVIMQKAEYLTYHSDNPRQHPAVLHRNGLFLPVLTIQRFWSVVSGHTGRLSLTASGPHQICFAIVSCVAR